MNDASLSTQLFSLSGLILGITSGILVLVLLIYGRSKSQRIWALFNFSVAWWGIGVFFMGTSKEPTYTLFITKIAYVGVIFIPVFFYHFSCIFSGINRKYFILISYIQAVFFSFLSLTNIVPYISNIEKISGSSLYYIRTSGGLYNISFIIWISLAAFGFFETFLQFLKEPRGIKRNQFLYLFLGFFLGFTGGLTNFLPVYGFNIVPLGNFTIPIYCFVSTYAILKFHLLDIKVVITRLLVFILVYLMVLGIPFGLFIFEKPWLIKIMGEGWAWIPMVTLLIMATVGPFLYIFLQHRAEDKLLRESRHIQEVLIKFSIGLSSVRELQKLIRLIVNGLGKRLQVDFIGIYLLDPNNNEYVLKMSEPALSENTILKSGHPLLHRLRDKRGPLILDELKHVFENEKEENLATVINLFQSLNGTLIIPAIKENIVLAFVVLGKGKMKEIYSREFLDVLTVVGNQIALAIENALFYEETGKDWIQRAHESRQKTMGAMGTGVAHQIRNRFNAISSQGLFLQDLFVGFDFKKATEEDFENIKKEYNDTIGRIFGDIEQGVEICENIKNYAKNTEAKPQAVELSKTITGAMRLLNLAKKNINFTLGEDNTKGVVLWTNLSMLQDMFLNMFDNSDDAIGSKKEAIERGEIEKNNDSFKVNVRAHPNGKMCEIVVEDNGNGILPEHLKEDSGVNVMWFTTKGAAKGTGMGIHFMREFVKHNGGTFKIESAYTKWTRIIFTLPLATEEQIKNGGNGA